MQRSDFRLPDSYSTTSWRLNNQNKNRTIYGRALPYGCQFYLDIEEDGERTALRALTELRQPATPPAVHLSAGNARAEVP